MENLVKEEIKEETMDIGTEFLPASSAMMKTQFQGKDEFCNAVLLIRVLIFSIADPRSNNSIKRRGDTKLFFLFCIHKYHKVKNI